MLYISELCKDCAVANEIDDAWTNIHGIYDNGPRDHSVWRLTLTVYNVPFLYSAYHIQMASLCAWGIITPALAPMQPFSAIKEHSKE